MAGALEDGIVTPDTVFATPWMLMIGGTEVRGRRRALVGDVGRGDPAALVERGNDQDRRKLGKERFDAYVRTSASASSTGLGFPGEAPGIMLPLAQYNDTSMASMPIGNGLAVTAMQMLDVYMTLANGGVARPPRLVAATVDDDGTTTSRRSGRPSGGLARDRAKT